MRILTTLFILFVILLGITFACLNADIVHVNYYIGSGDLPLSLLLVAVLAAGVLLGLMSSLMMLFRLKRERSRLQSRIKVIQKEVENLRAIPIQDRH